MESRAHATNTTYIHTCTLVLLCHWVNSKNPVYCSMVDASIPKLGNLGYKSVLTAHLKTNLSATKPPAWCPHLASF